LKERREVEQEIPTKESMIRFLLGDLSPDEQEGMEITLFDEEVFDKYLGIEIELIEKYLDDQLSSRDSELFERNYLTTRRGREQVEAVKAVASYLDSLPDPPPLGPTIEGDASPVEPQQLPPVWQKQEPRPYRYWLSGGLAALCTVLLFTTLYFRFNWLQQARQIREIEANSNSAQAQNEREMQRLRENNNALSKELEKNKYEQEALEAKLIDEQRKYQEELRRAQRQSGQNQGRQISETASVDFDFDFGVVPRGADGSSVLPLGPNIKTINFRVNFPLDKNLIKVSQVKIQPVGEGSLWESSKPIRVRRVGGHSTVIVKNVPAARFSTGDYVLTLLGMDNQDQPKTLNFPFALKKD
jgi:cell division protein FtsB